MGQESLPVMLKAMDEIFTSTTRRSCVEETRVFIPLSRDANVEALAPVRNEQSGLHVWRGGAGWPREESEDEPPPTDREPA